MRADVSPKVLNPAVCLAACGGIVSGIGLASSDPRLRRAGVVLLGASVAAGVVGWESRDPLRVPYVEPGFAPDPELAEHRARAQTG